MSNLVESFRKIAKDEGEQLISLSRLFADDTSLGYSSQSVDQIKTVINHDLLELNACLIIFVIIFSKCSFHFAFWEMITPRCLWLVDKGILLPLKENSMLSMLPVPT
jgi:hypothetical protein